MKENLVEKALHSCQVKSREGGDNGMFITLVPKRFLICWLINIGNFYRIFIGLFI